LRPIERVYLYISLLPTLMAVVPESTRAAFAGSLIIGPLLGICGMLLVAWRARRAGEIDRRVAGGVLLCWSPFLIFLGVLLWSVLRR
jgi:hypothetical protein